MSWAGQESLLERSSQWRRVVGGWAEGLRGRHHSWSEASIAGIVLSRVSKGKIKENTRDSQGLSWSDESPSWRPKVTPRVRRRWVHVQAREVRFCVATKGFVARGPLPSQGSSSNCTALETAWQKCPPA